MNNVEAAVQKAFAQVLGRPTEELSVAADFFTAGGTSLQVFRATALLQDALGIESIPATLVHTGRTVQGVAAGLSEMLAEDGAGVMSIAPIAAREWQDEIRPLSTNQELMWILSTLAGSSA